MKKFAIAAFASILFFGSSATIASGNPSSGLTPISAEDMMNYMQCRDKKPTDIVKSRHVVNRDGKIRTVKCATATKIFNDAQK